MKRYMNSALLYAVLAMVGGVFYREFTKFNGFTGKTALGVVHTHYFVLGMVFFLLLLLLEKAFAFTGKNTGRVLAVGGDFIEIEGYGELPLSPTFQVFKTYGTFERKQTKDILVGYDNQEFVISGGQVCAALAPVVVMEVDTWALP